MKKEIFAILVFLIIVYYANIQKSNASSENKSVKNKIYWLIPDGLRADKDVFNIYRWADQGLLPNIKKLMSRGSYGYSWPVFPGHTPTNFATLLTGTMPKTHGIADGSMRNFGYPVKMVVKGGFSSFSKKVPAIWNLLEDQKYLVSLQSVPGSTPPDLNFGNTIKGRWGGWGVEFAPIIFHSDLDQNFMNEIKSQRRAFNYGVELTKPVSLKKAFNWNFEEKSYSDVLEVDLSAWGMTLYGMLIDTTNDQLSNYDTVLVSRNKKDILVKLHSLEWSPWIPTSLAYQLKNDYNTYSPKKSKLEENLSEINFDSFLKINIISLGNKEDVRIRIVFDQLNEFLTEPTDLSQKMHERLGPMIDFVDHFPPQLIYFKNDKQTFLDEAELSWKWHQKAVSFLAQDLKSDFVIHSIYTPNQMLTSRWWLPFLDPQSSRYNQVTDVERKKLWTEALSMYQNLDTMVGEIMKNMDEDSYIVLSSDHGVIPIDSEIRLNNLFAQKGWLKFKMNKQTNDFEIDWAQTKVVFLQMHNIYINTQGLDKPYQRENSKEYFELREEVIQAIEQIKVADLRAHSQSKTRSAADFIWKWEVVEKEADLPADRVGDLVLANTFGYNWVEDVSADLEVMKETKKGGYKQAVWPKLSEGMLTPFIIAGPGIKSNYKIKTDLSHIDQFATIFEVLNLKRPSQAEGKVIQEILIQ